MNFFRKTIEMSMDYFNGIRKGPKRNALKSSSISAKIKNAHLRSRNNQYDEVGNLKIYKNFEFIDRYEVLSLLIRRPILKRCINKYNTNNSIRKNLEISSKKSATDAKNISNTGKNSRNYKRLSDQRNSELKKIKQNDKENRQKFGNKNPIKYSRNSLNSLNLRSNISSTGAYNEKTRKEGRPTTSTKVLSKNGTNQSSRCKPIYQI
jgi:hypothetical protein